MRELGRERRDGEEEVRSKETKEKDERGRKDE